MPRAEMRPWSAAQIMLALSVRYKAPEYALLPQVRNQTGYSRTTRTADAIAMSLWPSRGLDLHGFEIKSARHDWVREKENPEKAEEIAKRCDRWWIVVGDETIVQDGELPPTWGLLVPRGKVLAVKVDAPRLEGEPIDRPFLAALLRKTASKISRAEIEAAVAAAREEEREQSETRMKASAPWDVKHAHERLEALQKRLDTFEQKSGVKIDDWNHERIADAVKFFADGYYEQDRFDPVARLKRVVAESRKVADEAEKVIAAMKTAPSENR